MSSFLKSIAAGWLSKTSRGTENSTPPGGNISQGAGEESMAAVASPALSRSGGTSAEECFACTQIETPAFHSISCNKSNHLHWEANAGSSVFPTECQVHQPCLQSRKRDKWIFGIVLDPRSKAIQRWNRIILPVCAIGLAIDLLFFYVLSISKDLMCI